MLKAKTLGILILIILFYTECKKDKKPILNIIPAIELISADPTTLIQFQEPITFTIQYEDGDGDIGFEHPDSLSFVIQDSRLTEPDKFHIKPLSPPNTELAISGTLTATISTIFLLGSDNIAETTTFTIKIKDRAGNWSNTITSPVITINP